MTIEIETHTREHEVSDLVSKLRRLVEAYDRGERSAVEGDAERICGRLAELGVDVVEALTEDEDLDIAV